MNKIHDPNVDAMFRNRPQPPNAVAVATPINDPQLVSLMAAHMVEKGAAPGDAADLALRTFAEVCAQFYKFQGYIQEAQQRQQMLQVNPTQ